MKTTTTTTKKIPLPEGITEANLKYPQGKLVKSKWVYPEGAYVDQFEIWYTERFGWCVPTLTIRNAPRGSDRQRRTYAVTLDGSLVRIGQGPHVLMSKTVYVTEKTKKDLAKYLELRTAGEGKAGEARDVRSTRMLRGQMRRRSLDSWWM